MLVFVFKPHRAVLLFPSCCFTGQPRQPCCPVLSPSSPPQSAVLHVPVQRSTLLELWAAASSSPSAPTEADHAGSQDSVDWTLRWCQCRPRIQHLCVSCDICTQWFIYLFLPACLLDCLSVSYFTFWNIHFIILTPISRSKGRTVTESELFRTQVCSRE